MTWRLKGLSVYFLVKDASGKVAVMHGALHPRALPTYDIVDAVNTALKGSPPSLGGKPTGETHTEALDRLAGPLVLSLYGLA